jgi:hypothetical protein
MTRSKILPLALALLFPLAALPQASADVSDLSIGGYILAGKTKVGQRQWHLSYRARLTNQGTTNLGGATADLQTLDLPIVDGHLTFGPVAAGQSVTSSDTFTLASPNSHIRATVLERILKWTIALPDAAPHADAGGDLTAAAGDTVTLDGTGSSDPDGDTLAFAWALIALPAGSASALVDADQPVATFAPDRAGDYLVRLTVDDGRGATDTDTATVHVGEAPAVPPPTVVVDPEVAPQVTLVPGNDGEPDRPVTAVTDRSNIPLHFVENELVVVSDDLDAVTAIASRYGGIVVRSFVPGDYGLPGVAQHLVRIEPGTVDPSGLVEDLQALEPASSNALRVASESGLRLMAAAAHESAAGTPVGLNLVAQPFGFEERTTIENGSLNLCSPPPPPAPAPLPPDPAGCTWFGIGGSIPTESFNTNAYAWSYMNGPTQNIGVGEAWRSLSLAGMLGGDRVKIGVLDGGFSPTAVDNPVNTTHFDNGVFNNVGYPPNEINCTNGTPCPWHGANVVSAAMGPADDGKGAAGPGGPVADAITIRYSGDNFNLLTGIGIAVTNGTRIINMSFGWRTPATLTWSGVPFNLLTAGAASIHVLFVAAAGNEGADVDSEDCAPPFDTPCWEDSWWAPCENDGVVCIGALADNSTMRRPSSNYGAEDVDLFAPGNVWVGGDPVDPEPHTAAGTSVSAPFVSGVAALMLAANSQLHGDQAGDMLVQTARSSPNDTTVSRIVDAQAAVNQALGGSPVCTPPTLLTLTPDFPTVPCVERVLEITHTQAFGPFRYQWRKLIPGTTDWVDLHDGGNITGATTARMTINPFLPTDEGRYDVVVSNLCGSTTSGSLAASVVDGHADLAPSLPLARDTHAMAYDSGRNRMVLYGGNTPVDYNGRVLYQPSNETWERLGDGTWQVVTDQGPGRRSGAAMAYDEARGVTVLFGGGTCMLSEFCPWGVPVGEPTSFYDTWEWNGTTWTQIPTGYAPYPFWHSMTYDSIRQRVVMYGGQDAGGSIGATPYEWDGSAWTPRSTFPDPTFGYPPPVLPSPIAFDRARNVLVLYRVWDTWELDGTGRWARKSDQVEAMGTTSLPGGMSFDTDRGRTLLFNDVLSSPTTMVGALWEWTGSTWIRKPATTLPIANALVMAYDRGRRRTVFTGFLGPFGLSSAVWEWRYFTPDPTCSLGPQ